jgi:O-antigen/teichoic acid export membrane protein
MSQIKEEAGVGRRITRYGTILTLSGIVCKLLLLVYTVLAVEILGKDQFGRIEYFVEMGIIFSVLLDFGLEQTVTREIARRREIIGDILWPLLTYRFLLSFAGVVVMALFLKLTAREGHTWALILCATTYFFVAANVMTIRALVRSMEWLPTEAVANILDKVFHIGAATLCLFVLPRLPVITLCYTLGVLVAFAVYFFVLVRHFGLQRKVFSWRWGLEWQRLAVPIGLSASCILLLHRQDTAMVNWICGDAETGLYRAPYRFLEGLFLFPQVVAISAYPIFSKLYHDNQDFSQTASVLLRGLMMLCLPISVGGMMLGDEMILFFTPRLGEGGATVFKILVWSLPFIYANFLLGTILNATNRQNKNLLASACGLICNAALNIPAIYYWGAFGASVVTIVSQGLYCLIMLYFSHDLLTRKGLWRYGSILLSCACMAGALHLVSLPWYGEILIGAVVYAAALLVTRGIAGQDKQKLLSLLKNKTP